jgi:hypothetical protein
VIVVAGVVAAGVAVNPNPPSTVAEEIVTPEVKGATYIP